MSTRGVSSGLPIGGAIHSNGHRLQADRIGGSAVVPVGILVTSLCLAAHTTWWCLLHSCSALVFFWKGMLFGGWLGGRHLPVSSVMLVLDW